MYNLILKETRSKNKLLQKDLAKILGISEISYTNYETEYYIMPLKYLITLANYFKISLDYMFEFSKINTYQNPILVDLKNIGNNLKIFRKQYGITQKELAQVLNTNQSVIANYERGRTLIATPFLYTICKKYNVSADYLLGRIDSPKYLKN